MLDQFTVAAATAAAWAQLEELGENTRRLARIVAAKADSLAQRTSIDAGELAYFETIGCHLCWRTGAMRCDEGAGGTPDCPLAMDAIKAIGRAGRHDSG